MQEKQCTRCKETKIFSDFQKRSMSKDGMTASCKKCLSSYDKSRANKPHRVEMRARYAKTDGGKESGQKAKAKYIEKNPVKRAAHVITGNAIRSGALVKQPCEECGALKVHAHHDDYQHPMSVTWLCDKHHNKWHIENGEGLNG